jgi:hypothetical protein
MDALGLILLIFLGSAIGWGLFLLRNVRRQPRIEVDPFVDERLSRIQTM